MVSILRILGIAAGLSIAAFASALTFNVTSPTSGTPTDPTFLGSTNTISFSAEDVQFQITVDVTATDLDTNTTITREQQFTPSNNRIDSSIPLNFSQGTPEGNYKIDVSAEYTGDSSSQIIVHLTNLKLDITKPKVLEFNPGNNSFVRSGIVHITAHVQEANFKNYTVQVNGQDIPNNTGTSLINGTDLIVDWDTSGIQNDGSQTISVKVTDKANNEFTQSMTVTLDRIPPSVTIRAPGATVQKNSTWNVVVDVQDASASSTDVTGIDVILTRMDGTFLYRVPRASFSPNGSNTNRWTGHVQGKKVSLPSQIKLKVTTVDKAGNIAVVQSSTINVH